MEEQLKFKIGDRVKIPKTCSEGDYREFLKEMESYHDHKKWGYLLVHTAYDKETIGVQGPNDEWIRHDCFHQDDLEHYIDDPTAPENFYK